MGDGIEKIFDVSYDVNSGSIKLKPIKGEKNSNVLNQIYKAIKNEGSSKGHILYISERRLQELLDYNDGR